MVEFEQKLKEFKDKPIPEGYKKVTIDPHHLVVEVFVIETVDSVQGMPDLLLPDSEGNLSTARKEMYTKNTHVARVVKSGKEVTPYLKEGSIVILKPNDCLGEGWNPDFLHLHQFSRAAGIEPIIPKGMREKVPRFQERMQEQVFLLPEEYQKKAQDIFTFIIHQNRVQAAYDI